MGCGLSLVRPIAEAFDLLLAFGGVVHQVFYPHCWFQRGCVFPAGAIHIAVCLVEINDVRLIRLPRAFKDKDGGGEIVRPRPDPLTGDNRRFRFKSFHNSKFPALFAKSGVRVPHRVVTHKQLSTAKAS